MLEASRDRESPNCLGGEPKWPGACQTMSSVRLVKVCDPRQKSVPPLDCGGEYAAVELNRITPIKNAADRFWGQCPHQSNGSKGPKDGAWLSGTSGTKTLIQCGGSVWRPSPSLTTPSPDKGFYSQSMPGQSAAPPTAETSRQSLINDTRPPQPGLQTLEEEMLAILVGRLDTFQGRGLSRVTKMCKRLQQRASVIILLQLNRTLGQEVLD